MNRIRWKNDLTGYFDTTIQAMAATIGHGPAAGLINGRAMQDGHPPVLAAPRLALA